VETKINELLEIILPQFLLVKNISIIEVQNGKVWAIPFLLVAMVLQF
jgi:hypothetical protein